MSKFKPGEIILSKNTEKKPGDNKPYYIGHGLNLDGVDIDVNLWVRGGVDGNILRGRISVKATEL